MNLQNMLKQTQAIQKKIEEFRAVLDQKIFNGSVGNESVVVSVNGAGRCVSVKICKDAIDLDDMGILEDMVCAAFNKAKDNIDQYSESEMSKLGIPTKLPF